MKAILEWSDEGLWRMLKVNRTVNKEGFGPTLLSTLGMQRICDLACLC